MPCSPLTASEFVAGQKVTAILLVAAAPVAVIDDSCGEFPLFRQMPQAFAACVSRDRKVAESYRVSVEDIRAAVAFASELVGDWDYLPARG